MRRARTLSALVVGLVAFGAVTGLARHAGEADAMLARSTPEAQGISSNSILGFIEEAEQKIDALHSFMLVRHGQVVAEGWWEPYAANERHALYSLSKSFTSTAVGLAIADGKLSVDDPVLRFFPEDAPSDPSANLRAMRVRDLLTMSTGHHDEDVRNFPYTSDESVVKNFLARPVSHKPGTFFFYNTPASYMLSAIVQKVTGQPVLEYLRPRLFEPLGIAEPTWDASKQGVSLGGFGLSVRTEDIASFGQLYLQKGEWKGKQLVPAAWIDAATARQMSNGSSPSSDWEQGYGYQFWRSRHGFYRGDGAHGQFCLILPQYDAVVAITSGTRDMASVMNLVWDRIVPALKPAALPADAKSHAALTSKLKSLRLKSIAGAAHSATQKTASGKRYVFASNPQTIEAVTLEAPGTGDTALVIRMAGVDRRVVPGYQSWRKGTIATASSTEKIAANGAWTADDTYTVAVARYNTPFVTTYRLQFAGDRVGVTVEQNVGAAETRTTRLEGKLAAGAP